MPMPTDKKQVRSLLGGINYHGKFLPNLFRRLCPINALLKQDATFDFTLAMEATIRAIPHELTEPPILVYPDWDAVADNSRPSASTATLASTASGRLSSKNNPTAPSAPSSTSAAPPWTLNVHGHPSTSRPAASSGRSSNYAGICGPLVSRYIRTIRYSRTLPRLASTMLASGAGSSSFRPTPTRWSTAKARPTTTPTSFHAYHNQPPTPTAPDATA